MMPADAPTVFVIDDDDDVRASIQGLLEVGGLTARDLQDGTRVLTHAERSDGPSCLVLDVSLPEVSGLDFQQELADACIRIPIIFITGSWGYCDEGEGHEIRCGGVPD